MQRLLAEDRQDVVRVARPVHQRFARADTVAFLDVHVHAAGQRVLSRLATVLRHDDDLPLPLDDAAVADDAVDLGDDRGFARLARFEELDHARQTARDVLRLRRFARDLREHFTREHRLAVLDHQVRVRWHVVLTRHLTRLVADFDQRLLLLIRRVDHDLPREAGDLVDFLVIGHVADEVLVLRHARFLGEDRERVRIPLDQDLSDFDLLAIGHLEPRAVDNRVALAIAPLRVLHDNRAGAVHDHALAGVGVVLPLRLDYLQALIADRAGVLRIESGLLADS